MSWLGGRRQREEGPARPAQAYWIMEKLLPPEYFLVQPPRTGTTISVIGKDRIQIQFSMGTEMARHIIPELQARVIRYTTTTY